MAATAMTLPTPLQKFADPVTHQERTQLVLNDLVPTGTGERYVEGVSTGTETEEAPPSRWTNFVRTGYDMFVMTGYDSFCKWCEDNCDQLQPFSNNWELAAKTAPESSLWRKRVEAYRDVLWESEPGKPFSEYCSTRKTIMVPAVFWPWVARTWRAFPKEVKDAFHSAAAIRFLTYKLKGLEHGKWTRFQSCGRDSILYTDDGASNHGIYRMNGYDPTKEGAKPYTVPLSGWRLPVYVGMTTGHTSGLIPTWYYTPEIKTELRVFTRIDGTFYEIEDPYRFPIAKHIATLLQDTPDKTARRSPQVKREARLPTTRCFHDDLLESVASQHDNRTDLETIVQIIYSLRSDGFVATEDAEDAFIREYRAFCRRG